MGHALRLGTLSYVFTPPPNDRARQPDDGWRAHWPTEMQEELYDLAADPGERENLVDSRPEEARLLREQLAEWIRSQSQRAAEHEPLAIDPQLAEELRALGYAE